MPLMMENLLLVIILAILVADFLLERWLDYLNGRNWSDQLPPEAEGIYDTERYRKSQQYFRANQRLSVLTSSLNFLIVVLLILLGGFAWLDDVARSVTNNPVLVALLFFGVLGLAADILSTPFSVYSTFVIEEGFGFNRTSVLTYITDKLKGWLLAVLIGGGLLALVIWIYLVAGPWFWLWAWLAVSAFTVFMAMFYSEVIVPLFNKQTPLEPGELRDTIESFAAGVRFRLSNIYVIDGSRRSAKANAYFAGLGAKKRIVLYDTLIRDHTTDELVAVLAHEIGHYKKKHTLAGTILSIAQNGLVLFIFSQFVNHPALSLALGAREASFHMGLVAFGILYAPLSLLLGLVMNGISRRNEYTADKFAAGHFNASALAAALRKLSANNLSNLRPHPAYVFFYYSHPPLLKRLAALERTG
jgi:STE24 endopeptidase